MLAVAVALAGGVGASRALPTVSPVVWAAFGAFAASVAAVYVVRTRRRLVTLRPLGLAAAVVLVAGSLGAARDASRRATPPNGIAQVAAQAQASDGRLASDERRVPLTLWATVASVPARTDWAIRFTADADSVGRADMRGSVSGRVQVSLFHNEGRSVYPALRPGDRVRLTGHIEPLPHRRNPAGMDYGAHLARRGVAAMVEVRDETGIAFLAPSRRLLLRTSSTVRRHVRRSLARNVSSEDARGLLLALLLADRSAVDSATLEAFRETGLMHLLAVSGLHVGLVGLALYGVLKPTLGRLGVPRRRLEVGRASATLVVLALYVIVTGASVSVVRAFVMVSVLLIGRATEQRVDSLNALGLAAVAILVHRPAALLDVGFQLSFGAVAALVTLTPLLNTAVPDRVRQSTTGAFLVGSVTTSVTATLGTAPALLAHFGRLPLGGLVLNLPAIPLTGMVLGCGLLCVVATPVPPIAAAFGAAASACGDLLIGLTETGARTLGWATYNRFLDDPSVILASVLGLTALALSRRPIARRRVALAGVASLTVGLWTSVAEHQRRPSFNVLFFDVGQGDATLLSFPNGRHVLVDAGLRSPYVDHGERTLVPHFERFGIDQLDALVLTHADADHIGGAQAVMRAVEVQRVVTNGRTGDSDLWAGLIAAADSLGVPVTTVGAGDTLAVDPSVRLRVLGPSASGESSNDDSVVLRAEHGSTRWLFTGDAEAAGEAALVTRYGGALAADVVTVGHHGSETSSTAALVGAVGRPGVAGVSVARRNRYGLPDAAPLDRWRQAGADVRLTSDEGAVWVRSDGAGIELVDWR